MSIGGEDRAPLEHQSKFRQLELLFELAGAVNRARDPHEIYRAAVQGVVHAVDADGAAVLIFDTDGVLRFKEWIGLSEEYRAAVEGHTYLQQEPGDTQAIAIADVMQDASRSVYQPVAAKLLNSRRRQHSTEGRRGTHWEIRALLQHTARVSKGRTPFCSNNRCSCRVYGRTAERRCRAATE